MSEVERPVPMEGREYIIFKGKRIVATTNSIAEAWAIYEGQKPKNRSLVSVGISIEQSTKIKN